MAAEPVPKGYHTATPYLIVRGAAAAIDFYKQAFGATELMRFGEPRGKLGHAEIKIGDSPIMLADEAPEMGFVAPPALGGTPVLINLYVPDVDTVFRRALDAGAKELRAVRDQFYGDRSGTLTDPFGHVWTISTHKADVSLEEAQQRMQATPPGKSA